MTHPRWLDETQQQVWRALLVLTNRGLPRLEHTLNEHGLLVVQYGILVALSDAPGETMRLLDLADAANLSQSRLTHRLRTLIERGDVSIEQSPDDGRGKNATLTADGRRRLESVAPHHAEDVHRLIFDHLDATDTEHLARALSKVAGSLCEHAHFDGACKVLADDSVSAAAS
jgi:DNA-binding MarR family transcriptional regulator